MWGLSMLKDRVGIGWRPELAAGIFANLDQIDLVEVIADDYFNAPTKKVRALKTLATQIPVVLHGVSMGLASTIPVKLERVEKMARLIDQVQPEFWSEHLAFVRAAEYEIGHLAAPPRTAQSIEGALRNVMQVRQIVGSLPLLENIATLIDPPASTMEEAHWVTEIISGCNGSLLLDLHNLYANAVNFGEDPQQMLVRFPLERVTAIHLSGGKWIAEPNDASKKRLLDDHIHDVPAIVYELLSVVASQAEQPLTVILERDGDYPTFESLVMQINLARQGLAEGRHRQVDRIAA